MNWISEQFKRVIEETGETSDPWCVTLESKLDTNCYIQLTAEHINLAYPRNSDPHLVLDSLPSFPGCVIDSWEANRYLTLVHGIEEAIEPMGDFCEQYATEVLGVPASESSWNSRYEIL